MRVVKRDGTHEYLNFNKIATRLKGLKIDVSTDIVAQKVMSALYDGIPTEDIDTLAAETAIAMATESTEYEKVAIKLCVSNIHKKTPSTFTDCIQILSDNEIIKQELYEFVMLNSQEFNFMIKKNRDHDINFFGLKNP